METLLTLSPRFADHTHTLPFTPLPLSLSLSLSLHSPFHSMSLSQLSPPLVFPFDRSIPTPSSQGLCSQTANHFSCSYTGTPGGAGGNVKALSLPPTHANSVASAAAFLPSVATAAYFVDHFYSYLTFTF